MVDTGEIGPESSLSIRSRPSLKSSLVLPQSSEKKIPKNVSFSKLNEFFMPIHALDDLHPESALGRIGLVSEKDGTDMIADGTDANVEGSIRVSFKSLKKVPFFSEESLLPANQGEKAFSLDLVFEKLMAVQLAQEKGEKGDDSAEALRKAAIAPVVLSKIGAVDPTTVDTTSNDASPAVSTAATTEATAPLAAPMKKKKSVRMQFADDMPISEISTTEREPAPSACTTSTAATITAIAYSPSTSAAPPPAVNRPSDGQQPLPACPSTSTGTDLQPAPQRKPLSFVEDAAATPITAHSITAPRSPLTTLSPLSAANLRRTNSILPKEVTTTQPAVAPSSSVTPILSATQFRRHERDHRHMVVAVDLARGIESYNLKKLIRNILVVWFLIPFSMCSLVFGVTPYSALLPESSRTCAFLHESSRNSTSNLMGNVKSSSGGGGDGERCDISGDSIDGKSGDMSCPSSSSSSGSSSSDVGTGSSSSGSSSSDLVRDGGNLGGTSSDSASGDSASGDSGMSDIISSIHCWAAASIPWVAVVPTVAALGVECYSGIISEIEFGVIVWEDTPLEYVQAGLAGLVGAVAMQGLMVATLGLGCLSWFAVVAAGGVGISLFLMRMFVNSRRNCHGGDTTAASAEARLVFTQCMGGLGALLGGASVVYVVFAVVFTQYRGVGGGRLGMGMSAMYPLIRLVLTHTVERSGFSQWGYGRGMLCAGAQATVITTTFHVAFLCHVGTLAALSEVLVMGTVEVTITFVVLVRALSLDSQWTSMGRRKASVSAGESGMTSGPGQNGGSQSQGVNKDLVAVRVRLLTSLALTWVAGVVLPLAFLLCAAVCAMGPNRRLFGIPSLNVSVGGAHGGRAGGSVESVADRCMWSLNITGHGSGSGNILQTRLLFFSVFHVCLFVVSACVIRLCGGRTLLETSSNGDNNNGGVEVSGRDPFDQGICCRCDLLGLVCALVEYHTNIMWQGGVIGLSLVFTLLLPMYGVNPTSSTRDGGCQ